MATITHTPVPVGRCAVSSSEARLADMATQTHMAGSPVLGKLSFALRAPHVTRQRKACRSVVTAKATKTETGEKALTGVVYEPFVEVQNQALQIPNSPKESLARQRFDSASESAINDQINVEYNASYIYHALWSYFDRDNVALPGLAKYFKDSSAEERGHAEAFMEYQNKRGGRVKLQSIVLPPMEFGNEEKGDALYAMEIVLSIEKLTTEKLHAVYKIAEENNDSQLTNFLDEYLAEQVEEIKEVSSYVAQLRRIGNDGHGVYYWDSLLK